MLLCTDSPSCVFQLAGMTGVKTIQVRGQVCTSGLVFCLLQYRQLGTRQSECLDACIASLRVRMHGILQPPVCVWVSHREKVGACAGAK